jgi:transcriptional regulator with XRE-family HTH domain
MRLPITTRFGRKVREERTTRGLSQEKLAELANVHRTYVGMIERGECNITITNIEKIAKGLKVPITSLFEG